MTDILGTAVWAIAPDGSDARPVVQSASPTSLIIGSPGTPAAGRVYLVDQSGGTLSALGPDGSRRPIAALNGSPDRGTTAVGTDGTALIAVLDHQTDTARLIDAVTGATVADMSLGDNPLAIGAASAGTPGPATLFALSQGNGVDVPGSVTVISRGLTPTQIAVGVNPCCMGMAPAGSPAAGTVYVPAADGTLTVIGPDRTTLRQHADLQVPTAVAIAPPGTPDAGTVYLTDGLGLHTLSPTGTAAQLVPHTESAITLAVAPAGTPRAGTIYLGRSSATLAVVDPTTHRLTPLTAGTGARSIAVAPAGTSAPGTVYAASIIDGTVAVFSPAGTLLRSIPIDGQPFAVSVIPAATAAPSR